MFDLVAAMAEDTDTVAVAAEATKRASEDLSASAARIEASAAAIESVADGVATAAAAKIAESTEGSIASFKNECGRIAHDALAEAACDVEAHLVAARNEVLLVKKAARAMAIASAVLAVVAFGFSYAIGRLALDQVASANAAIESTNELVKQVNEALGAALPPAEPIPGAAMAGIIDEIFGIIWAGILFVGVLYVAWLVLFGRKRW